MRPWIIGWQQSFFDHQIVIRLLFLVCSWVPCNYTVLFWILTRAYLLTPSMFVSLIQFLGLFVFKLFKMSFELFLFYVTFQSIALPCGPQGWRIVTPHLFWKLVLSHIQKLRDMVKTDNSVHEFLRFCLLRVDCRRFNIIYSAMEFAWFAFRYP